MKKQVQKPIEAQPLHVAAYLRVSTEEQKDSGLGLGSQEQKARAMAVVKGWNEPILYVDADVTGTIDIGARPAGARLIQDIEAGKIDAVIVAALDRLGRKAVYILNFAEKIEKKAQLISCKETIDTTTAIGRFVLRMFASLAELERDTTSERTIAALEERGRTVGIKAGIPPYGYRYDTTIVKNGAYIKRDFHGVVIVEEQAAIVRLVFALRKMSLSYRAIAGKIEEQTGTSIAFKTVQLILDRESVYRGGPRGETEHTWPVILNVA